MNLLDGAVQMGTGLRMHRKDVRANGGELIQIAIRIFNHQMYVKCHIAVLTQRLDYRHTKRNAGDKRAVHHIQMQVLRPRLLHVSDILCQTGEVRRQQRGR